MVSDYQALTLIANVWEKTFVADNGILQIPNRELNQQPSVFSSLELVEAAIKNSKAFYTQNKQLKRITFKSIPV